MKFETESDTEVLLQVFVNFGLEGIKKLSGMFSICLIDNFENTIYLIRDQFGIKPLYYLNEEDKFSLVRKLKFFMISPKESCMKKALWIILLFNFI